MQNTLHTEVASPPTGDEVPQSPQEFYDLLVRESELGRFPSAREDGLCMYRGPEGRKCVAGHLIPDAQYDPVMEDEVGYADDLFRSYSKLCPTWANPSQLRRAQVVHDEQVFDMRSSKAGWSHSRFVRELNELELFADCAKVSPGMCSA